MMEKENIIILGFALAGAILYLLLGGLYEAPGMFVVAIALIVGLIVPQLILKLIGSKATWFS